MALEELTGKAADSNCLHCYLPPIIDAWMRAHPNKEPQQILIELAQTLGDLLASVIYGTERETCMEKLVAGLACVVDDQARDVLRTKHSQG